MEKRERIEPGNLVKKFLISYILILYAVISLADIIFIANDHENVVLIRSIIMSISVILGTIIVLKSIAKKHILVKDLESTYKTFITIAIIAVAILSIFYFMYCVKSNVNKIEDGSEYRSMKMWVGEKAAQKLLEKAAEEAREDWYTVWGVMIAASAVAVPVARKIIDQSTQEEYNNQNNIEEQI